MEPFSDSIGGYYRLMWFTSDQMWATVLGLHTGAFTGHSGMEAGDPASSSARASLAGDFRPHLQGSSSLSSCAEVTWPWFTEDKGGTIGRPGHVSSVSVSPIAYWSRQTPDHVGSLERSGVYFEQQLTAGALLSSVPLESNQFQKQFSNPA